MNFKIYLCTAMLMCGTCTVNAAPLFHSILLDDFTDTVGFNILSGSATAAYAFPGNGAPGITGRRDISLAYQTGGPYSGVGASLNSSGSGSIEWDDIAGLGVAPTGFVFQYDYGTNMSGIDPLSGLDTGTPTQTISAGFSKFVLDLGTIQGSYDVTFYVMGDTAADYASATQTVSSGDSDQLIDFSRTDFYGDLNGDFATTLAGAPWIYWAPYVTSFAVEVLSTNSVAGNSFELNEIYATIPEPSSMLAMAGLFGGAGFVGLRRKRVMRKVATA